MALYKRKEWLEICGIESAHLSTYKKRGKVIFTGKMIDDSIPENAYFKQRYMEKKAAREGAAPLKVVKDEVEKIVKPPRLVTEEEVHDIEVEDDADLVDTAQQTIYDLGVIKKKADIEKTQQDIELTKLKRQKLEGELVPTDLVIGLFATHFKSVTTAYQHATENLLSKIAKRNNLDRKQVAEIRGELTGVINDAIKLAMTQSKKDISKVVAEYSETRGRGERA